MPFFFSQLKTLTQQMHSLAYSVRNAFFFFFLLSIQMKSDIMICWIYNFNSKIHGKRFISNDMSEEKWRQTNKPKKKKKKKTEPTVSVHVLHIKNVLECHFFFGGDA